MVDMVFVDSKSIEAIGYDEVARELHVRFLQNGTTYVYEEVDGATYAEFLSASSKGSYINRVIKPRFQYHQP